MAYRIADYVLCGEIDNRECGKVIGRIWILGFDEPLSLDLTGNCWRDLAGCFCEFRNPNPQKAVGVLSGLSHEQTGEVGDINASRKVRVPDISVEEFYTRSKQGLASPEHMANVLYIEWYSESNGRVVIESTDFELKVTLPSWEMSVKEEQEQKLANAEAMQRFLNKMQDAIQSGPPIVIPEDREMNEFEYEKFLRECDARTEKYCELFDKFHDDPNCDEKVDQLMGWSFSEIAEHDEREELGDFEVRMECEWKESEADEDNEENEADYMDHPLQLRCREFALRIFNDYKQVHSGDSEDEQLNKDLMEVRSNVMIMGAKVSGALSGFGMGYEFAPGMIIAYLKRALGFLNEALNGISTLEEKKLIPEKLSGYRLELMGIREEIIGIMKHFRQM